MPNLPWSVSASDKNCGCQRVYQVDRSPFLQEVSSPQALRHVDESQVHDRSTPHIEPGTHIKDNPAKAVLAQLASGELPPLKHVDTEDRQ